MGKIHKKATIHYIVVEQQLWSLFEYPSNGIKGNWKLNSCRKRIWLTKQKELDFHNNDSIPYLKDL